MITEETKIIDCDLSIYAKKILSNNKIETVKDLLSLSVSDLIKYIGFGEKSKKEILHFVNINNLNFNN